MEYWIKSKRTIHQKYIIILNVYKPTSQTSKYKNNSHLQGEIDKFTIIGDNFYSSLSITDETDRKSVLI